jgi:hypothetical protein
MIESKRINNERQSGGEFMEKDKNLKEANSESMKEDQRQ